MIGSANIFFRQAIPIGTWVVLLLTLAIPALRLAHDASAHAAHEVAGIEHSDVPHTHHDEEAVPPHRDCASCVVLTNHLPDQPLRLGSALNLTVEPARFTATPHPLPPPTGEHVVFALGRGPPRSV